MWRVSFLLCVAINSTTTAVFPTFSPLSKNTCKAFQYNWAAEIRCLRTALEKCSFEVLLDQQTKVLSNIERKQRSVPNEETKVGTKIQESSAHHNTETYYGTSVQTNMKRNINHDSRADSCSCTDEKLKSMEAQFSKRLYEVKMKAAYDTETKVAEVQRKVDMDMRVYQSAVIKDILELTRKLDFLEASRIVNNNLEYFLIQREESWYTASEKCHSYGGRLVSIHSRLVNSLVSSLIPKNSTVWVGVNDIQVENVFKNVDGSLIDYFNWGKGQPNNEEHNENCVEMDHNGVWNDKLCVIARPYICEKQNVH